jgi:hypothetical protein
MKGMKINQDSWALGLDLNSGIPEYVAGILTTWECSLYVVMLTCFDGKQTFMKKEKGIQIKIPKYKKTKYKKLNSPYKWTN